MEFRNELISEQDIAAYGLDDRMRSFYPWGWRAGRPVGFVYHWVVDHKRKIFLLPLGNVEEVGPSGRPEPTRKSRWLMQFEGHWITVTLEKAATSSTSFSESPFRMTWKLSDIDKGSFPNQRMTEVLAALREALEVYGYRGAVRQVPRTVVHFEADGVDQC